MQLAGWEAIQLLLEKVLTIPKSSARCSQFNHLQQSLNYQEYQLSYRKQSLQPISTLPSEFQSNTQQSISYSTNEQASSKFGLETRIKQLQISIEKSVGSFKYKKIVQAIATTNPQRKIMEQTKIEQNHNYKPSQHQHGHFLQKIKGLVFRVRERLLGYVQKIQERVDNREQNIIFYGMIIHRQKYNVIIIKYSLIINIRSEKIRMLTFQQEQPVDFNTHRTQIILLLVLHISAWSCLIRSDYNFVFLFFAYFYLISKRDKTSIRIIFGILVMLVIMDILFFIFVPGSWMTYQDNNYVWNGLRGMHGFAIFLSVITFLLKIPLLYFTCLYYKQVSK